MTVPVPPIPNVRYDHVAFAAPRIRDLLTLYRDLLGGTFVHGGDNPRVGYRALQLALANGQRVELMEPLDGSTFFDRFFERTGGGGFHHITFKVDDIFAAIAAIETSRYSVVSAYLDEPRWREVFLHPKQAHGCLIQIVQSEGRIRLASGIDEVLAGSGPTGTGKRSP